MIILPSKSINSWRYLTLTFLLLMAAGSLFGQIDLAGAGQTNTEDLVEISAVVSHRPVAAGKNYQAALIVDCRRPNSLVGRLPAKDSCSNS